MRILWFSVTPSGFDSKTNGHNGGGWISSLESIIKRYLDDVELGVAFEYEKENSRDQTEGVTYYTISPRKTSFFKRLTGVGKDISQAKLNRYLEIIRDFRPDVIQIFGSENDFGRICAHTDIPVVIHMQGCLPPYRNALYPVEMNKYDFLFCKNLTWRQRLMGLLAPSSFERRGEREIFAIKSCRYFMGRTDWDRSLVKLFNPAAEYFHCEEALRDSFINAGKTWEGPRYSKEPQRLISILSNPWYKGIDLILKTARILKRFTPVDFVWKIYGVSDIGFYESKYKINGREVGVKVMGTASKNELVDALCESSVYVHPSYIDNSPNSVCEAQYLGVPVIATNVGGLSSIVKDKETGILVPANAPYYLANTIRDLINDPSVSLRLSANAKRVANSRHNPQAIALAIKDIYSQLAK